MSFRRIRVHLPVSLSRWPLVFTVVCVSFLGANTEASAGQPTVDFNRDIRSILSNNCFTCHGPDDAERQAGLRLDIRADALKKLDSDEKAIIPGNSQASALVARITTDDDSIRMPPAESGKRLTKDEIDLLTRWIDEGATYAKHWSYVKPERPLLPDLSAAPGELAKWPRNAVDHFVLARLLREGLKPTEEADRPALIRRLALDLTGLPPSLEQVDRFLADDEPGAYERLVDELLASKAYGEHWARKWLDLARYADSAGYADDPPRTIWAYRDYVIRSLNDNTPFDQFTIDQLAGDLLASPTPDQLIATAFQRNTMTNNEGGTSDEEYRNVAVVDRVNTALATWMGTTIACAQCHNHKYDPISQEDYFRVFALFNSSADADVRDESPLFEIWTDAQNEQKAKWQAEIAELQQQLKTQTPELLASREQWEKRFATPPQWQSPVPAAVTTQSTNPVAINTDGAVRIEKPAPTDVYEVSIPLLDMGDEFALTAIRLDCLADDSLPGKGPGFGAGNFVITRILGTLTPPASNSRVGRFVRVEMPGKQKILSLAEVQVFSGGENVAPSGQARQSSTAFEGPAPRAIDANTDGNYQANSVTHTAVSDDPWWEVDLKQDRAVDRIVVWNRTDNNLHTRLANFRIMVLDEKRNLVSERMVTAAPNPSSEFSVTGEVPLVFSAAHAEHSQDGFAAGNVLDGKEPNKTGWAIAPRMGHDHTLTLITSAPVKGVKGSTLSLRIEQLSEHAQHVLGKFRVLVSTDPTASEFATTPADVLAILSIIAEARTQAQTDRLTDYYLSIAPQLQPARQRLAKVTKDLENIKPYTTVPIMRELAADKRRKTNIQRRGNFLDLGAEVAPGLPESLFARPSAEGMDRMTLARWLVDRDNPLTARVLVNRYWESIFGVGIVRTSEEFGSQGDLPTNQELLDWLACEVMDNGWDLKYLLKLLVTSAAYRQSSRVTEELVARDPDNRLLARGPRFRLSAEMVRDQALFVSGLLSPKMYGPPVNPPQPSTGLSAAFGSGIDWKTSTGEDKFRRALYTSWRRSNPYPSMTAFDAPNREVCTVRRDRTNTPLQALVTLNDPVYIEAAQALSRRIAGRDGDVAEKVKHGFRLCLARLPSDAELSQLVRLFEGAREQFGKNEQAAKEMATNPLGPAPDGLDTADLAAWSVVGNVLLNLDETLMRR